MNITLLGTGSPIPDPNRAGPSTLVTANETQLLVDAGRGVLMRLAGAFVAPPMLHAVLVTHMHSDHLSDLNDVVTTRWVMSQEENPLRIYGPVGIKKVVDGMMEMLSLDISYRIAHHDDLQNGPALEVVEVKPGDEFQINDVAIRVGRTNHAPVEPSVAYRIEQNGVSVVMGGDGIPCAELDELCVGANAYVQTVIRDDIVKMVPLQRFVDILDYHSSVSDAAKTAQKANVKTLILTHYVPAIAPGQEDEWRAIASEHFSGEIVLGNDLTSVALS